MRFYRLTEAGKTIARRISNPDVPNYKILAWLYRLHSASTEKLMEMTGLDLGTTQMALSRLQTTQPPLVEVAV